MTAYADKPWTALYEAGKPDTVTAAYPDALSMFRGGVEADPDGIAIHYFDGSLTRRDVDTLSDAFASALLDAGLERGGRVALYLQNVPQFVIGLVGIWKAGGIAVSVNPMNREREVELLLNDSGSTVLVTLESLYRDVAAAVVERTPVRTVVTTSELEYQSRNDSRLFSGVTRIPAKEQTAPAGVSVVDMAELLEHFRGTTPPPVTLASDDIAMLTYTSGTTGPPKGAMNGHGNMTFNAEAFRHWCSIGPGDVVYGVAPLFHITGLVAGIALSMLTGAPLVLFHRFEPGVAVDAVREHRPTFTVASITVYIALMNVDGATADDFSSMTKLWSGGAPIPPSTVEAFQRQYGRYIHNIYGLTETTSPSHAVPRGATAPVDEASGALSVGLPWFDTDSRIVGDDGQELAPGEVGEIAIRGPQVVRGYWKKPEETAKTFPDGELRTGDVGYMDDQGWFYIVDRKKDQINAGGYKVWPREVEDVLYEHEAVREAAVVGVPDEYRGETVKAFVSLRPGHDVTPAELIEFAKGRMAAYKYPRQVEVLDEIPKTASGKLLRRELRGR
ncbi:MAG: long-chain fatty acid--CoA ligase [Pseudonocardiaceae bacterium]|nr:MAG: long-chain fatty acid--CoA ligase [Pseudonocardiaceae bacterium]